jgi:amidophosphoribosyltransferase
MKQNGKLSEECAVFGVNLTTEEAVGITYNGLLSLQHRGQEGAGIAVVKDGRIWCHKDIGLVSEVFSGRELETLPNGSVAVGHTRYSTTGGNKKANVGPFVTDYLTGRIATAHNGNITNAKEIRDELKKLGLKFDSTSDSEVISSLIAYCITNAQNTVSGVIQAAEILRGAFSLVIASGKNKLIAVRDPSGYRPLCIGRNNFGFAAASESCALEACGFEFIRDVQPGEIVIAENGNLTHQCVTSGVKDKSNGLCIFEYVYFARADSVIDGLSVYEARYNMGAILAEEYPVEADVVCGAPDSGLDAASGYSAKSGIPLVSGFVKNRYIGRSFIYPTQTQRDSAVRLKLNPLSVNLKNRRVVLVDDSLVRGTTTKIIVRNLKNAGAKEVHLRVASPQVRYSCNYGTDIDSEENLVANKMSLDEFRREIEADSLAYISIEGLKKACSKCTQSFCTACYTGNGETPRAKKDVFE